MGVITWLMLAFAVFIAATVLLGGAANEHSQAIENYLRQREIRRQEEQFQRRRGAKRANKSLESK